MTFKIFSLITLTFVHILKDQSVYSGAGNEWSYKGNLGPAKWYTQYPACNGRRQSPVNINKCNVQYKSWLTQFQLNGYGDVRNVGMGIENNGHTVEVDLEGKPIFFRGAGHSGVYKVKQFHFHWGARNNRGSEHALNRYHFPMEMHIVHYAAKYGSFKAASRKHNGLAVLAFFFQVGRFNPNFEPIVSHLTKIGFKGQKAPMYSFPLLSIMPSNLVNYYRYQGSLTTPPCYQSVIWTIFKTPEEISQDQLNRFRYSVNANNPYQWNQKISDDYRPIQPLNRRRIYSSDPSDAGMYRGKTTPRQKYKYYENSSESSEDNSESD